MKSLIIIFLSTLIFLVNANFVSAEQRVVTASAEVTSVRNQIKPDLREITLKKFFKKYNSPLTEHSGDFIYWADKYNLDWRLIPSITGVESTFGKRIPKGSFNAYGWNNGNYRFNSWENSIEHVAKTLKDKYYDKGANDIHKIARRYAPPSSSWEWKVKYFMEKIDSTPVEFDL
jgi:hypothetical protein